MELLTSHTIKNPNHKFLKGRGCKNFQWANDSKPANKKFTCTWRKLGSWHWKLSVCLLNFNCFIKNLSICKNMKCICDCLTINFEGGKHHDLILLEYL